MTQTMPIYSFDSINDSENGTCLNVRCSVINTFPALWSHPTLILAEQVSDTRGLHWRSHTTLLVRLCKVELFHSLLH